jgi:hypothetical protein
MGLNFDTRKMEFPYEYSGGRFRGIMGLKLFSKTEETLLGTLEQCGSRQKKPY